MSDPPLPRAPGKQIRRSGEPPHSDISPVAMAAAVLQLAVRRAGLIDAHALVLGAVRGEDREAPEHGPRSQVLRWCHTRTSISTMLWARVFVPPKVPTYDVGPGLCATEGSGIRPNCALFLGGQGERVCRQEFNPPHLINKMSRLTNHLRRSGQSL